MTTKTKPKKKADSKVLPITLSNKDKTEVATELLCFGNVDEASQALEKLTFLLSFAKARLNNVAARPLPAHIRAELEPIKKTAEKLLELICADKLTNHAALRLPQFIGRTRDDLQEIIAQANIAIKASRHEGSSDGGALNKLRKELIESELQELEKFFDDNAKSNDRYDRSAFIEFCRKCISS